MLSPETLTRHELVGLPVRVADAPNADLIGIGGRVVSETMRTLTVREAPDGDAVASSSRDRQVPKRGTTFEFRLDSTPTVHPDGAAVSATPSAGRSVPADITAAGGDAPAENTIDEAASGRKAAGTAPKREEDTAGVRPGQSCSTVTGSRSPTQAAERDCEDAVYVTVDGTRLLSRPALRTETVGDTKWQSD